jgi:hypothetical protein
MAAGTKDRHAHQPSCHGGDDWTSLDAGRAPSARPARSSKDAVRPAGRTHAASATDRRRGGRMLGFPCMAERHRPWIGPAAPRPMIEALEWASLTG